ncbi:MAG: PUR family DNA/RNA-binding protein [Chlorobi bacterium]|nr:PUR family DNA/RNA-binding protein [Chlorobiota bacterium]
MSDVESKFKQEIYSKVVRAGKRTYFFDVKSTRNDEFYLTITESKKKFESDGKYHFEKHKVFLYKEDFNKFIDNLQDVIDYIQEKQPVQDSRVYNDNTEVDGSKEEQKVVEKSYTDVEFEDLAK